MLASHASNARILPTKLVCKLDLLSSDQCDQREGFGANYSDWRFRRGHSIFSEGRRPAHAR
jgi:hypothetical protein